MSAQEFETAAGAAGAAGAGAAGAAGAGADGAAGAGEATPADPTTYANTAVRTALETLQKTPDYEQLANFLNALRSGFLIADVTGAGTKKKGFRARTLRTAQGKLVLPLFTAMDELRQAVASQAGGSKGKGSTKLEPKGAVMPALEALAMIRTAPFVAVEFDSGSAKQVLLRKFVDLVLSDAEITAESLAAG